jgi:hypothetical protein
LRARRSEFGECGGAVGGFFKNGTTVVKALQGKWRSRNKKENSNRRFGGAEKKLKNSGPDSRPPGAVSADYSKSTWQSGTS